MMLSGIYLNLNERLNDDQLMIYSIIYFIYDDGLDVN